MHHIHKVLKLNVIAARLWAWMRTCTTVERAGCSLLATHTHIAIIHSDGWKRQIRMMPGSLELFLGVLYVETLSWPCSPHLPLCEQDANQ